MQPVIVRERLRQQLLLPGQYQWDTLEDKDNVQETESCVSTFLSCNCLWNHFHSLFVEMSMSNYGRFLSVDCSVTCSILFFAPFGLLLRRAITELLTKDANTIPLMDVLLVNMIAR